MSWIRSLITLILVSLLVSVGCVNRGGDHKLKLPQKTPINPSEPKGPGGGEMK